MNSSERGFSSAAYKEFSAENDAEILALQLIKKSHSFVDEIFTLIISWFNLEPQITRPWSNPIILAIMD